MLRHIQYLTILKNEALQSILFFLVPMAALVQAMVFTNTLRTPLSPENMIQFIAKMLLCFNTISHTLLVYGGQATIYTSSEEGMASVKRHISKLLKNRRERLLKRKFYKSCPLLKVKIGAVNFFDQLTPLVMLDQANDLTINFLLLSN